MLLLLLLLLLLSPVVISLPTSGTCLPCAGGICRSWLVSVLQEALDVMTKEKARLRADMEFLQRQLDMVAQQADQVRAHNDRRPCTNTSGVSPNILL